MFRSRATLRNADCLEFFRREQKINNQSRSLVTCIYLAVWKATTAYDECTVVTSNPEEGYFPLRTRKGSSSVGHP